MAYLDLLTRWNRHFNLTATRDPEQMLVQHLFDCLAATAAIESRLPGRALRVLDVGSGAGLPGVVMAIVRPTWQVLCVDAVAKKAGFVQQVGAELAIDNLAAEHARVEALRRPLSDVVVSRALASLGAFVRLTRDRLEPGGCWVAMKGRIPEDEIAALPPEIEVFHVEPLRVPEMEARRCLVWMRPDGRATAGARAKGMRAPAGSADTGAA